MFDDGVYYAYGTYRSNEGIGVATSRDLKSWNWWQGKDKDGLPTLAVGGDLITCRMCEKRQ